MFSDFYEQFYNRLEWISHFLKRNVLYTAWNILNLVVVHKLRLIFLGFFTPPPSSNSVRFSLLQHRSQTNIWKNSFFFKPKPYDNTDNATCPAISIGETGLWWFLFAQINVSIKLTKSTLIVCTNWHHTTSTIWQQVLQQKFTTKYQFFRISMALGRRKEPLPTKILEYFLLTPNVGCTQCMVLIWGSVLGLIKSQSLNLKRNIKCFA